MRFGDNKSIGDWVNTIVLFGYMDFMIYDAWECGLLVCGELLVWGELLVGGVIIALLVAFALSSVINKLCFIWIRNFNSI